MKNRTRFAPSPTGYMHIGNLRTALYEYLIAKSAGGDFILRIEDTDQKRYVEGATDIIFKTLKRVGMNWDEGPDIGGEFGPYVQSERRKIYQEYAHKLVELGGAHYCFCAQKEENEEADEDTPEAHIKFKDPCLKISLEEAKKRDHRKLGKELELFFFDETAPGMAYWLPKGFTMMNVLIDFWRKEHKKRGYQEFSGPQLNSSVLWKTSGHWDHYKEDMFVLTDADGNEQALKPMNCPNSIKVYQTKMRSYKDLPLRFNDVDVIHRNEKSGQLNGLFRVRMFRQDDSHNYVTEKQIGSEIKNILELTKELYSVFGLDYVLTLSTRPDDYMGEIETWNRAESDLKAVMNEICGENNYRINEGDGAFYGPKIDIKMKDCLGREWQMGTIQLDFQLPQRFELYYIDEDGERKTPIMIHRAIFGSFDRFIGIITEHFAGAFPMWLSPVQIKILPISTEKHADYAKKLADKLDELGFRVEVDDRNEKIGYKIREAQVQKIPYMLVIGDKEMEEGTVGVRNRKDGDLGAMKLEDFIAKAKEEVDTKAL